MQFALVYLIHRALNSLEIQVRAKNVSSSLDLSLHCVLIGLLRDYVGDEANHND